MSGLRTPVGLDIVADIQASVLMNRYNICIKFSCIDLRFLVVFSCTIILFLQAYWEWSWDELAAYDLPAAVQYVNDQTGQKLHYVGHSLVNIKSSSSSLC